MRLLNIRIVERDSDGFDFASPQELPIVSFGLSDGTRRPAAHPA